MTEAEKALEPYKANMGGVNSNAGVVTGERSEQRASGQADRDDNPASPTTKRALHPSQIAAEDLAEIAGAEVPLQPSTSQPADIVEKWMQDNKMGCGVLVQSEKDDLNNRLHNSCSDASEQERQFKSALAHERSLTVFWSGRVDEEIEKVDGLVKALESLIADCGGYEAWQRPCLAYDNAVKALAAYRDEEGE